MSAEALPPAAARFTPMLRRLDMRVLLPALLLAVVGLVSLASDKPHLLTAQARWCAIGLGVVTVVALVPYGKILRFAYPFYVVALVLLLIVLVPGIGLERNGGRRWLGLGGLTIQPSELAKVAVVLALAKYIRFRRDHRTFKGLFVPFAMTFVPLALILKEPDLGTALMLVPVLFAMLWAAGAKTKHLIAVVLLGVASLPLLYGVMADHQQDRVDTYLAPILGLEDEKKDDPDKTPVDTYQRDEAMSAVSGGGLFGQGFRSGRQNVLNRVPFSWTDFIFVVHAEEWGFLGVLLLLGLEGALLVGLATVAKELKEPAGRLLAVGAMVLLGTQIVVNLGMTMGLAPITGLPLPFLSYGGSAMVTTWLLLGLVLNAKAREPVVLSMNDFE